MHSFLKYVFFLYMDILDLTFEPDIDLAHEIDITQETHYNKNITNLSLKCLSGGKDIIKSKITKKIDDTNIDEKKCNTIIKHNEEIQNLLFFCKNNKIIKSETFVGMYRNLPNIFLDMYSKSRTEINKKNLIKYDISNIYIDKTTFILYLHNKGYIGDVSLVFDIIDNNKDSHINFRDFVYFFTTYYQ